MRIPAILALVALAVLAACAKPAPEPVLVVEPVSVEPEYTGKYK